MAKKPSNSGTRWSTAEDVQLCKSWRVVSHDGSKGKDRQKEELWDCVHKHYAENWAGSSLEVRTSQGMINRWKTLKKELLIWHSSVRKAREWYKSGMNMMDEERQAKMYYLDEMKSKKMGNKDFNHWEAYEVVKGFEQFQDIPSNTMMASMGGSQQTHTQQQSEDDLHVNLDVDEDEEVANITPSPSIRPQGKKAAKEALRKGKKLAYNPERMILAVETMAVNQAALVAQREKREQEYQHQLYIEQERENRREQMEIRKETFLYQERAMRIVEREEQIMEMDTSQTPPFRQKYWQNKQRKISEKDDNDATGGTYAQPSFTSGSYPQPPCTSGSYLQPPFNPHPNVGGFSTDESTNPDPSNTEWF